MLNEITVADGVKAAARVALDRMLVPARRRRPWPPRRRPRWSIGATALMSELATRIRRCQVVRQIIQRALDEDIGWGDVTTDNSVPADQRSRAVLLAKQDGVLCGGRVFAETLALVDPARHGRAPGARRRARSARATSSPASRGRRARC